MSFISLLPVLPPPIALDWTADLSHNQTFPVRSSQSDIKTSNLSSLTMTSLQVWLCLMFWGPAVV